MRTPRVAVVMALYFVGVVLLVSTRPALAQFDDENPLAGKPKHLTVKATLVASDPFADLNQASLPPGTKMEFGRGETFVLRLTLTPDRDWYTYPLTSRAPDQPEAQLGKLTVEGGTAFQPVFPLRESPPQWKQLDEDIYLYHPGPFTVSQTIYVKPNAPTGKPVPLQIKVRAQVCSKVCTWEDHTLEVPVPISSQTPVPVTPELTRLLEVKPSAPVVEQIPDRYRKVAKGQATTANDKAVGPGKSAATGASKPKDSKGGLLASILTAILGGYVSLLTPCVFPMVPITVSYFLKQSETEHSSTLLMALVYCLTLVLILTLGGLLLLKVLVDISVHWITNFVLGAIFLFFALSLLGMYDITLPSWLQDATSAREGKGGLAGVFFMALTFSIVSFACVGPIYGGFISLQATSTSAAEWVRQALPVLAFSVAFASPFFLLALFPTLLRGMPRAGSWMNSVKVVMGFLELAAVVKFLRAAELSLRGTSDYFTFDLSLGMYIALAGACGLYLLGLYRLPHDHDVAETIGVPRLMFGLGFLTLGIYLAPGLIKKEDGDAQRPRGTLFAWTESFLLPDTDAPKTPSNRGSNGAQLVWHHNLEEALATAEKDKKLVFIDFTGTLCTNCKLNERNVFPRPEVQAAFGRHVLVKLYTDTVPAGVEQKPDAGGALNLRNEVFQTGALPLYAIVRPQGKTFEIVRKDEQGLIDDVPAFVKFLTE